MGWSFVLGEEEGPGLGEDGMGLWPETTQQCDTGL